MTAHRKFQPMIELERSLGLTSLEDEPVPPRALAIRALFRPSFDPPVAITVRDERIELVAATRIELRGNAGVIADIHVSEAAASPAALAGLQAEVAAIGWQLADDDWGGIDGMPVRGEIRSGGEPRVFHGWSPGPERAPEHHRFFAAVHRLAAASLLDEASQVALENLHGYLELGFPGVDRGGTPRVMRIFGLLSSTEATGLERFLGAPDPAEPLVLDLRNLHAVAGALVGAFRSMFRRPGPVVCIASPASRQWLLDLGVDEARIFEREADAVAAAGD